MEFSSLPSHRPEGVAKDSIWIFSRLGYGYLGLDAEGGLAAIFPVAGRLPPVGRNAGAIRVEYLSDVKIDIDATSLVSSCCIVSITDRALERSFWALAVSISQDLAKMKVVTAHDFGCAFASWEQLFSRRRRLSFEEEQGLWGELFFLSQCASIETAIGCWRGPNADDYDFLGNGIALEVKTSRRFGRHTVSHAQVIQADQGDGVFLVSIWVGEDPHHGLTLPALLDIVSQRTQDPVVFESKLLETGYSHADSRLYDRQFVVLDSVTMYEMATVPRVRQVDPGVISLSYSVQLNPELALSDQAVGAVIDRAFSPN